MKAITYLKEIKKIDSKINADIEELSSLEALATKTTAVLEGERVQSSGSQQKMESCVLKIIEIKDEITNEIDRFIDYKTTTRHLLAECDADCMNLLYKRYFQYKDWEQIAVEMRYTYHWVKGGLHQKAISQFQKILNEKLA